MTYQQETLARALNHVDDEMILAAHGPRKKLRRVIPVAVTLCLLIALAVAFPYLREVIDTDSDILTPENESLPNGSVGHKPESSPDYRLDQPATLNGATATLLDVTETTVTFEIVKTDDAPLYFILYGRRGDVLASSEPDYKDNGVLIRHGTLKLYVNGDESPVYELPTAAGSYRVTVDFTSIRNGSYLMQERIGLYDYKGEEETMQVTTFSLALPAESDTTVSTEQETTP